jgi:hypothetical protein
MKVALVIIFLIFVAYLWYDNSKEEAAAASGPPVITNPWFAEIRASSIIPHTDREIEMALFVRTKNEAECTKGSQREWGNIIEECPTCKVEPPKCSRELTPRYARLFDDVAIPSVYLSATAAGPRERDLRLVIYGMTDQEGMKVCEMLRTQLEKNYTGASQCIPPSGG